MKKIRIDTSDPIPNRWRIYLDDQDISSMVYALQLNARVDELPEVHLFLRGLVDLPDEIQAIVKASIDDNLDEDNLVEMTAFQDEARHFARTGG